MILRDYTEFAAGFPSQNSRDFLRKGGFSGILTHFLVPVAQLEECRFPKPKVAGSIPVGCAYKKPLVRQRFFYVCGMAYRC